jgi:hypothetical protein
MMEYTITELIGDYPLENQPSWDFIGPLDDAITLARLTFDLSPDKNNPLYHIIVMELLHNENIDVEYLIHHSGEYRGKDATQMSDDFAKANLKNARQQG